MCEKICSSELKQILFQAEIRSEQIQLGTDDAIKKRPCRGLVEAL